MGREESLHADLHAAADTCMYGGGESRAMQQPALGLRSSVHNRPLSLLGSFTDDAYYLPVSYHMVTAPAVLGINID